ncbi:MAG: glycosyltransferase [Polyangiaceae bacterium]
MKFLFVIPEAGGNVPSQLTVARSLLERGHGVHVLGDAAVESDARAAGASFSPFRHAPHHHMRSVTDDVIRDWEASTTITSFKRYGDLMFFGPAAAYARDVLEAAKELRPDAIAVDFLLFGALIGAEKSGVPTAMIIHQPYTVPSPGATPVGFGLPRARGPLGRVRDALLRRVVLLSFGSGLPKLNAARVEHGLPPVANIVEHLSEPKRTLVLTSQAFDFVPDPLPAGVRYVGPQLDDPTWAAPWTSPWPEDHKDPLVLVSLGSTFQNQGALVRRIIEALGSLRVRGLVTLGGQFAGDHFTPPSNVVVVPSAPHAAVLPRARAVVCHGGHGTVMKALSHGLPIACVPLGRDQLDNGRRAEACGAGLTLKKGASTEELRAAISELVSDGPHRAAALRMKEVIARDLASGAAVRELEALALGARG